MLPVFFHNKEIQLLLGSPWLYCTSGWPPEQKRHKRDQTQIPWGVIKGRTKSNLFKDLNFFCKKIQEKKLCWKQAITGI